MFDFLTAWGLSTWHMLLDSASWLIVGLLLAGLVRLFLNDQNLHRWLGHSPRSQALRAAIIGVPLPLCSCSVLPVAYQIRKSGVSRAGTMSFLISTPETGVDSISLTYALMDPIMAVARPVIAFATALTAGIWETRCSADEVALADDKPDRCGCSCNCSSQSHEGRSWLARIASSVRYAFTDLMADLAVYLLLGYLLAGLVGALWGVDQSMPEFLRSGWGAYTGALVLGLPLYICATSSTPLAAALVAAGFSPGAALVLLMVGPATNLATLSVIGRILNGRAVIRYLITIAAVSILGGLLLDNLYLWWGIDASSWRLAATGEHGPSTLALVSALLVAGLIAWHALASLARRLRQI